MNISSLMSGMGPAAPEALTGSTKQGGESPERLAHAAREFEAILLRQILQSAQPKASTAGSSADATATSVYQDMFTNQLADCMVRAGGLGLSTTLQQQLIRQTDPAPEATATPRP